MQLQFWAQYPLNTVRARPDYWNPNFGKCIHHLLRLSSCYAVKHSHKFRHDPVTHGKDNNRIHVIWVNIAAYVSDIAIVADFVERRQHSWDENLKTAWNVRLFVFF